LLLEWRRLQLMCNQGESQNDFQRVPQQILMISGASAQRYSPRAI